MWSTDHRFRFWTSWFSPNTCTRFNHIRFISNPWYPVFGRRDDFDDLRFEWTSRNTWEDESFDTLFFSTLTCQDKNIDDIRDVWRWPMIYSCRDVCTWHQSIDSRYMKILDFLIVGVRSFSHRIMKMFLSVHTCTVWWKTRTLWCVKQ